MMHDTIRAQIEYRYLNGSRAYAMARTLGATFSAREIYASLTQAGVATIAPAPELMTVTKTSLWDAAAARRFATYVQCKND